MHQIIARILLISNKIQRDEAVRKTVVLSYMSRSPTRSTLGSLNNNENNWVLEKPGISAAKSSLKDEILSKAKKNIKKPISLNNKMKFLYHKPSRISEITSKMLNFPEPSTISYEFHQKIADFECPV